MKTLSILVAASLTADSSCGLLDHLRAKKFHIQEIFDTAELLHVVKENHTHLIIISQKKDFAEQVQLLTDIRRCNHHVPIILLVNNSSEENAIAAFRAGATDYIKASFTLQAMMASLARCQPHIRSFASGINSHHGSLAENTGNSSLVGTTPAMQTLRNSLLQMAHTDTTVLITGETGTGKDLVAACLHQHSLRHQLPLVSINCAAIPDSLLESELFGYQRGAFTGAETAYEGKLQQANGGNVFLDEIGDMSLQAQAKLLRVIESKQVCQLGGRTMIPLNVRLLAATNQNLEAMIRAGTFRKDLYYRILSSMDRCNTCL